MSTDDEKRRQELLRKLGINLDPPQDAEASRKAADAQAHKVALETMRKRPRPGFK